MIKSIHLRTDQIKPFDFELITWEKPNIVDAGKKDDTMKCFSVCEYSLRNYSIPDAKIIFRTLALAIASLVSKKEFVD